MNSYVELLYNKPKCLFKKHSSPQYIKTTQIKLRFTQILLCFILSLPVVGKLELENDVGSGSCYISCTINDCRNGFLPCALCLGKCVIVGAESSYSLSGNRMDNRDFCKIGCTISLCTKFSIMKDPGKKLSNTLVTIYFNYYSYIIYGFCHFDFSSIDITHHQIYRINYSCRE